MNNFVAMTKCFFCGCDDKIILDTHMKDISEMNGKVIDLEPCEKCKEKFGDRVVIIRTTEDMQGIDGSYCAMSREAFGRLFGKDFKTGPNNIVLMEAKTYDMLIAKCVEPK